MFEHLSLFSSHLLCFAFRICSRCVCLVTPSAPVMCIWCIPISLVYCYKYEEIFQWNWSQQTLGQAFNERETEWTRFDFNGTFLCASVCVFVSHPRAIVCNIKRTGDTSPFQAHQMLIRHTYQVSHMHETECAHMFRWKCAACIQLNWQYAAQASSSTVQTTQRPAIYAMQIYSTGFDRLVLR